MPPTILAWDSFQARARPLPRLPRCARGSLKRPPKTSPNGANNDCPRLRRRRQPSDQSQDRKGARPRCAADSARPRRRGDRMSNCHLVAGRSLIDLVASRLALRAPALRAATALTRPNRSAPTAVTVDPSRTVAEHGVERGDHLTHHRHDDDLRLLSGDREAIVERFECRIPITSAQRRHVEHVADARATTPDATASFELAAIEVIGRKPDESGNLFAAHLAELGKSAISVQANTAPTPGMEVSSQKRWARAASAVTISTRRWSSMSMSAVSPATRRRERRCSIAPSRVWT